MNQRKAGIALSYISIIIYAVIGLIYVPLLLSYMGKNEYGLYQLMGSIIAYFSVMDFGMSTTVTRYYSKYQQLKDEKSKENILAFSAMLYFVIAIVLILAGIVVYFNLPYIFGRSLSEHELIESQKIFIVLLINIFITLMTNVFTSVITAEEKFIFLKMLSILQTVLMPFVVIAVMRVSPFAFSMVIVQSIFNLIAGAIKIYYCFIKLKIKIKYHFFDKVLFKSMISFSASTFIVAIVDQIFFKSNQIILGIVSGTAEVAIYGVASQIYLNYMPLSSAVQGVLLPKVTKMVTDNVDTLTLSNLFIRVGRLQYIILGCVLSGFVVFGQEFISLWAKNGFESVYMITLLIILPFTIDLIQSTGLNILQAQHKYGYRAKVYTIVAIINIILAIPLGIKYGGIGCAAATGFSMLLGNGVIMNIYYYRNIGLDIQNFWKQILKISIPILGASTIGVFVNQIKLFPNIINFGFKVLLYLVIYIVLMYFFAMNNYEKKIIDQPLSRIKNKICK